MDPHPFRRQTLPLAALTLWAAVASPAQRQSEPLSAERIMEAIGARPGSTVCEIGAGDGEMSIAMARIAGPNGRVYTSELGEARIGRLRDRVAASGLPQITVVAGEPTKTNFPDAACDGILMRDVYHHFTDPAAMNVSISAALREGGRVAVIDFTPPGTEASRPADRAGDGRHGVYPETVVREMRDAGFEPVSSERPGQRWFMVVLSKPKG
jgi:ubiquinone/menaquinone biosynthesis C-methylase UbiE